MQRLESLYALTPAKLHSTDQGQQSADQLPVKRTGEWGACHYATVKGHVLYHRGEHLQGWQRLQGCPLCAVVGIVITHFG